MYLYRLFHEMVVVENSRLLRHERIQHLEHLQHPDQFIGLWALKEGLVLLTEVVHARLQASLEPLESLLIDESQQASILDLNEGAQVSSEFLLLGSLHPALLLVHQPRDVSLLAQLARSHLVHLIESSQRSGTIIALDPSFAAVQHETGVMARIYIFGDLEYLQFPHG
jgi:hypothetical protein